jgi:hypothetical protein
MNEQYQGLGTSHPRPHRVACGSIENRRCSNRQELNSVKPGTRARLIVCAEARGRPSCGIDRLSKWYRAPRPA